MTVWFASNVTLEVVDMSSAYVAAGSWLLREDRSGVASTLARERGREKPWNLSVDLLYFCFICAFEGLAMVDDSVCTGDDG